MAIKRIKKAQRYNKQLIVNENHIYIYFLQKN